MKFLVIGGDAAGMSAASKAKRNRPDLDVTVLEKTMDVSYSACGMPYNIADPEREIEDLVVGWVCWRVIKSVRLGGNTVKPVHSARLVEAIQKGDVT